MPLTLAEVEKIAHLARVELSESEKVQYLDQLSAILDYAARLNELDLGDVAPTTSALPPASVLREDEAKPSLPVAEALFNAPQQAVDQFQIQSVLDDAP
jgi:aspartyl-tRNA(Asn)/glutamyl-tRNA(Gln) amidotransferase subunit C